MPSRFNLTVIILLLSAALFTVSSETAARMDHSRRFNYANPIYIMNVIIALSSALTGAICLIDMQIQAKRRVKQTVEKEKVEA